MNIQPSREQVQRLSF